jgi:hypothetical protein
VKAIMRMMTAQKDFLCHIVEPARPPEVATGGGKYQLSLLIITVHRAQNDWQGYCN